MSESSGGARDWQQYAEDMIRFAQRALTYVEGMDLEDFLADERTYDAVLRNIELIGEAATHVPFEVREVQQAIEWGNIIGTRNQLAHVYLGIDNDIVWDVLISNLPTLIGQLRAELAAIFSRLGASPNHPPLGSRGAEAAFV